MVEIRGVSAHAGTTPMNKRQDALCAASELTLYMEQRAKEDSQSVATVGQMHVPNGSVNVIPGSCKFSMDIRAPIDTQRDRLAEDIIKKLESTCKERGLSYTLQETLRISAAPSAPELQAFWEEAVTSVGLPLHKMPSGAGHDAMKIYEIMPQAMLFVRGEHSGISHNPLESTTSDDMQLCVEALMQLLMNACNS